MPLADDIRILPASADDAEEVAALRRRAFTPIGEKYGREIPPMRTTAEEILREAGSGVLLKAVDGDGRIVGSVRGAFEGTTCHVGRLVVDPERWGQGIATALLAEIEAACPAERYELFTGHRQERSIALYERVGYRIFRREHVDEMLDLVFMEK